MNDDDRFKIAMSTLIVAGLERRPQEHVVQTLIDALTIIVASTYNDPDEAMVGIINHLRALVEAGGLPELKAINDAAVKKARGR